MLDEYLVYKNPSNETRTFHHIPQSSTLASGGGEIRIDHVPPPSPISISHLASPSCISISHLHLLSIPSRSESVYHFKSISLVRLTLSLQVVDVITFHDSCSSEWIISLSFSHSIPFLFVFRFVIREPEY